MCKNVTVCLINKLGEREREKSTGSSLLRNTLTPCVSERSAGRSQGRISYPHECDGGRQKLFSHSYCCYDMMLEIQSGR